MAASAYTRNLEDAVSTLYAICVGYRKGIDRSSGMAVHLVSTLDIVLADLEPLVDAARKNMAERRKHGAEF